MKLTNLFKRFLRKKEVVPSRKEPYLFKQMKFVDQQLKSSPVFITGVGRSGTHFLAELLNKSHGFEAFHLDDIGNAVGDSFLMFARWNEIGMDLAPFFSARDFLIHQSEKQEAVFIESNPYLALSIGDLAEYYPKGKFIVTVRSARDVVLSHYNKGWYEDFTPNRKDLTLFPFYDYKYERANHFFGRIFPKQLSDFNQWTQLTTVGKIAWMWQTINNSIKTDLARLNLNQCRVIEIDGFDYTEYIGLMDFLNSDQVLNKRAFDQIRLQRPGKSNKKRFESWGHQEEIEFVNEVSKFKGFYDV